MPDLLFPFFLGAFCGSRTTVPTAVFFWFAYCHPGRMIVNGTWFAFLVHPFWIAMFALAVVGELIVDKLPMTPSRLKWPLLLGRLCAGAFVGAVLITAIGGRDEGPASGALVGMSGALLGALIGYFLRTRIVRLTGFPDYVIAVVEDAVTIGGSCMVMGVLVAVLQ